MLHTLYTSPYSSSSLKLCLDYAQAPSAILLAEDAVVAAIEQGEWFLPLLSSNHRIYVLQEDVQARGLEGKIASEFEIVDIKGFVCLTEQHVTQMKW
ncbi:sulfurtransferase complex subunit TusB [Enterovibrio norvegicus]|uniref:sulfurtransferase complex subunit TusB n=1 Tax=Enterovibrio norvegicus TaxID=188144 RepID=UPI0013D2B43F|nr:sulfurtransferase complex subunit TusB [Enterovibrio norvegicus]